MRFRITGNAKAILRLGGFLPFRKEFNFKIDELFSPGDLNKPFKRTLSIPKIPLAFVVKINWPEQSITVSALFMGFEVYSESKAINPKIMEVKIISGKKEIYKGVFIEDLKLTVLN